MKGGVIRHLWMALLGIRAKAEADMAADRVRWTDELERMRQELAAGAYSRSLFSSTWALFIG